MSTFSVKIEYNMLRGRISGRSLSLLNFVQFLLGTKLLVWYGNSYKGSNKYIPCSHGVLVDF